MQEEARQIKEGNSILVLANNLDSFQRLSDILSHYFPKTSAGDLHLTTKYYTAKIQLTHSLWPPLSELNPEGLPTEQMLETSSPPQWKHDLLIMLVSDGQHFDAQLYDLVIHRHNPDNFILIVDTKSKEAKWVDEDVISGEVNNFIEIIKEDLQALKDHLPERTQKGLLDNYEDGSIFNLLELMETTQWAEIQRVEQSKVKKQFKEETNQLIVKVDNIQGQKQEGKQLDKECEEGEINQQISEEQLEQQMNNFQALMREMMNVKTAHLNQPVSHEQRKKAAEDMIQKLLGGSFL